MLNEAIKTRLLIVMSSEFAARNIMSARKLNSREVSRSFFRIYFYFYLVFNRETISVDNWIYYQPSV